MRRGRIGSAAVFAGLMLLAGGARADVTKGQCVDANTNGQNLRRDGKLAEARAQFLVCADPKCPDVVRSDCVSRFDEVEAAAPAIVFDVKGSTGNDLAAVTITVDGKLLANRADGKPLKVDPGAHEFTFSAQGEKTVTKTFVLQEGDKTRREKIAFAPDGPPAPPAPPPPPAPAALPDAPPPSQSNGVRVAAIVLGAAGVAGLGVGILGGVETSSAWSDQKKDCASPTSCRDHAAAVSDHSKTETWGTVSTVGFIAGVALLAGGVVLYFMAPKGDASDSKAAHITNPLRFSF